KRERCAIGMEGNREGLLRWGVITQGCILDERRQGVETKTVDVSLEPEPHHLVHRSLHLRIAPVQVRLFGKEGVQIPAPSGGLAATHRAATARRYPPRASARGRAVP